MANTELWTVEKFINDTLKADIEIASLVGVRVYSELIPPRMVSSEATYPCIVFQSMAPVDINGANTTRIAVSDIFAVKAIGKDSFASVDAIAARIDELLHGVRLELSEGVVFTSIREQPLSYTEVDNGVAYFYRGGLYRVLVH